jgi:hypothetical protein
MIMHDCVLIRSLAGRSLFYKYCCHWAALRSISAAVKNAIKEEKIRKGTRDKATKGMNPL